MSVCVCVCNNLLHAAPLDLAAVAAAKEEQRQKPLPSTPVKQGAPPPSSPAPKTPAPAAAAASASPFRRVMGFFGSSPKVTHATMQIIHHIDTDKVLFHRHHVHIRACLDTYRSVAHGLPSSRKTRSSAPSPAAPTAAAPASPTLTTCNIYCHTLASYAAVSQRRKGGGVLRSQKQRLRSRRSNSTHTGVCNF